MSEGAWPDNVFVERLWRSVQSEEVCLRACDNVGEAQFDPPIPRLPQWSPAAFESSSLDTDQARLNPRLLQLAVKPGRGCRVR